MVDTRRGYVGAQGFDKPYKWLLGLMLALLMLVPAGLANAQSASFNDRTITANGTGADIGLVAGAQSTSFDYRTLIPNGSEDNAALTSKQVSFNGQSWYLTAYDESVGTVTLFAAGQIGTSRFDDSSSDYSGSDIQAYLDALTAEGGGYAAVASAIADVDLSDVGVTGAKLYLISETELNTMPENVKRLSVADSGWKNYWLRTKGPNTWSGTPQAKNCYPTAWTGSSLVGEAVVTDTSKAVRPALKLNLNRVDFNETTKTFALKQTVSKTATFKVVNGAWGDGTDGDKTVTLTGYLGELKLAANDIPAVGANPASGYKAGGWDVTPDTTTSITEDTTYTYTYAQKQQISYVVTFKVKNGSWNDDTTASKDVTLTGIEGDELKLSTEQIPGVGAKPSVGYLAEGSWDVVPDTKTAITQNRTYTYTYAEAGKTHATVTFAVENGAWGDGSTENKTITLEGSAGADLKLSEDQIPAVGEKPNDGFKAGSWNDTPSVETVFEDKSTTTYTYTYAAKNPISATVTFKVVNGAWDDKTAQEKTVTLKGLEGDELKLAADDIPAVGKEPAEGYKAGTWDVTPDTETVIAGDKTYTYAYVERVPADDIKDLIPTEEQSMDEVLDLRVNFNGFQWYAIAYDDANNTCTLFASEKIGDNSWFHASSNQYKTSAIKTLLDGMTAEGGLFEGAAHNIKETNLTDINPFVENAKLFLLGTEEAEALPESIRKFDADYWLRSQSNTWGDGGAAQVLANGTVGKALPNTSSVQLPKAVRPALKIDLGKTEFVKETKTFKAKQAVTSPTAKAGLAYTDEEQELISPAIVKRGNNSEGAIQYSLDGQSWSAAIPTATVPGDYAVYYKVAGNDAYDEFVCPEPISVKIDKADPEVPRFLSAVYGQTLGDVKYLLFDPLPDGWSWKDPSTTSVGNAGERTFYANYKSTDPYINDKNDVLLTVYVSKADRDVPAAPTQSESTPSSITLAIVENGEYRCGDGDWQASPTFTGLAADTEYTFYQRLAEDENHYASNASEGVAFRTLAKADQAAPAAPTAKEISAEAVTLAAIENGEYRCGDGDWQASPTFAGLAADTEYTFYQRLAEDADRNASPSSAGATFTTNQSDAQKADQKAAGEAEALLGALPAKSDVKISDEAKIKAARNAYDALTDAQKALVDSAAVKKLTDAEEGLSAAKKAAEEEEAAKKKAAEEEAAAAKKKAETEAAKKKAAEIEAAKKKAAEEEAAAAKKKAAQEAAAMAKGKDGTALGKGAGAKAAERAITGMKSDADPAGSLFEQLMLKSPKQTKNSIKITWKKVGGAKTYVVYGNACGKKNKMTKLATVSKNTYNVKKANKKKLKKAAYYKFIVVALDKNKKVVSTSKVVHVSTKGSKKKANPTGLTVKAKVNKNGKKLKKYTATSAIKLAKGKSAKLKVAIKKAKKTTVKTHRKIAYVSSNKKVATVTKAGKVKAVGKGKCVVYAYAQNGLAKKLKVTVK